MYYAYPMATEFARDMTEKAREAFLVLYDESRPLAERYEIFRRGFDSYVKPLGKNHYQDLHAISVYLTFEYPNRYFFYKYSVYTAFCARVGYHEEKPKRSSSVWRLEANNRLHQRILEEVQKTRNSLRSTRNAPQNFIPTTIPTCTFLPLISHFMGRTICRRATLPYLLLPMNRKNL